MFFHGLKFFKGLESRFFEGFLPQKTACIFLSLTITTVWKFFRFMIIHKFQNISSATVFYPFFVHVNSLFRLSKNLHPKSRLQDLKICIMHLRNHFSLVRQTCCEEIITGHIFVPPIAKFKSNRNIAFDIINYLRHLRQARACLELY